MRYSITVPDQEYFDKNIPCRAACPIHTECGRYVQAIGISKDEEAYLLARAPNPFAYVLGRICAHPCEDNCRRGKIDEPIAICALKRYATDRHNLGAGHDPARKKLPPAPKRDKRIAIVGAGVCGLTCAHDLALLGYTVEVFESAPVPGGMLYLGIPQFRLPREIIKMEVDNILALGVTLRTRVTLGRDISFAELRSKFDAVLLATGLNKGRELNIPGAHLAGVYNGIDFLINVNLGFEIKLGKRVVVVGGGNVAIDVARAAVRLVQESVGLAEEDEDAKGLQPAFDAARMALRSGAEEVELVSLESRAQMPAWKGEVDEAEHEGIVVDNGWGPKEIVGENGVVTGLKVRRCLTVFDENGRFNPAFSDEEKIIPCDSVILAIGQQADLSFLSGDEGVQVTPRGILKIDENLMTTAPGVFAGGDVAFGPRILVEAVANGHKAARSIHVHLSGKTKKTVLSRFRILPNWEMPRGYLSDAAAEDAGAGCQPPHRNRGSGTRLRRGTGPRRRVALPQLPGQHHLRRLDVHSMRRLRGCMPGELPAPGGPGPGERRSALRRADSESIRRVRRRTEGRPGRGHHQERRKVHSLRFVRRSVARPGPSPWRLWSSRSGKSLNKGARA